MYVEILIFIGHISRVFLTDAFMFGSSFELGMNEKEVLGQKLLVGPTISRCRVPVN